jgi:hypothetical protein
MSEMNLAVELLYHSRKVRMMKKQNEDVMKAE